MSNKIVIYLKHILDAIDLIEQYTKNKNFEDFKSSIQLQDSVIRRLEIIGEAVNNIPNEFKLQYEEIPWKEIVGMRNVLIHKYFGIDIGLTWKAIKEENPKLKTLIEKLLSKLEE